MKLRMWQCDGRPVLVSEPNVRQYGHLGLEILLSLAMARETRLPVLFMRPRRVVSESLFAFDTDEVEIMQPGRARYARLQCRLALTHWSERWRVKRSLALEEFKHEVRRELWRHLSNRELAGEVRDRLKQIKQVVANQLPAEAAEAPDPLASQSYYRRRLIRTPVRTFLRADVHERARRQALDIGIPDDKPIVTIHVREAGYKLGREMQDLKPAAGRDDSVRNVRIESYFDTMDFLVGEGYTVVRIGDPSMTPVRKPGVIDLALDPRASDLLALYCMSRSDFLVGCESGPSTITFLTNTPCLWVNCTEAISTFPIRQDGLYILKTVVERSTGLPLTLRELLTEEYAQNARNTLKYQYVDNTSAEIAAGVKEMLALVRGMAVESDAQREYKRLVTEAEQALRPRVAYIKKWGADDGFLGDGRIARFFVEQRL